MKETCRALITLRVTNQVKSSSSLLTVAYVELSKLMKNEGEQGGLQETGQWQGYKESRDPEVGYWESSQVSYLTFKSLMQLRQAMDTGVVMLDREEPSLSSIMEKIVDEMIEKKEISSGDRDGVLKALTQNRSQSVETQALTSSLEIQTFSIAEKRDASESVEASVVFVGALDFLEKPTMAFVRLKEARVLETSPGLQLLFASSLC
ncbi:hypothetical protein PHYPO_G00030700 [Pangasianodon hypophthalmus]|uniref:Band 3 cytoplasmic domain-containing protein n=1 Tax=Pangasianodon hypophthalmus TaxID=310915 RepID=A0A5N5MLV6_PANHP|nr:hypothetical protein PHYPO_G00030700 [Pangasianodon hypophthalmus]